MPSLTVLIAIAAAILVAGALVVGFLASRRERGFGGWFLLTLLLTPIVSLPLLFALGRPCPRCGEAVRAGAKICRHCHYVLDRRVLSPESRPAKVDAAWTDTPNRRFQEERTTGPRLGAAAGPSLQPLAADPAPSVATTALAGDGEAASERQIQALRRLGWPAERCATFDRNEARDRLNAANFVASAWRQGERWSELPQSAQVAFAEGLVADPAHRGHILAWSERSYAEGDDSISTTAPTVARLNEAFRSFEVATDHAGGNVEAAVAQALAEARIGSTAGSLADAAGYPAGAPEGEILTAEPRLPLQGGETGLRGLRPAAPADEEGALAEAGGDPGPRLPGFEDLEPATETAAATAAATPQAAARRRKVDLGGPRTSSGLWLLVLVLLFLVAAVLAGYWLSDPVRRHNLLADDWPIALEEGRVTVSASALPDESPDGSIKVAFVCEGQRVSVTALLPKAEVEAAAGRPLRWSVDGQRVIAVARALPDGSGLVFAPDDELFWRRLIGAENLLRLDLGNERLYTFLPFGLMTALETAASHCPGFTERSPLPPLAPATAGQAPVEGELPGLDQVVPAPETATGTTLEPLPEPEVIVIPGPAEEGPSWRGPDSGMPLPRKPAQQ